MPDLDALHPLLVHFPIALFSAGLCFDWAGTIFQNNGLLKAGWWNMLAGQCFSLATLVTGFMADSLIGHMSRPLPIFQTHGSLQILAVTLLLILFLIRAKFKSELPHGHWSPIIFLLLQTVSVAFLFYGAHLGAKLADRI